MSVTSVTVPVTVEFEDVDAYGIAHHLRLIAYLERARLRLIGDRASGLLSEGPVPVMYELRLRFHRPVRLLDELAVTAEIAAASRVRLNLRYQIRKGDSIILRASSVVAFVDAKAGGVVTVPEALLARFKAPSSGPSEGTG